MGGAEMRLIDEHFGTLRGAVRLGLSYAEVIGGIAATRHPVPSQVKRLVFVCHGNICRSAFAEAAARQAGFNAASFGLSTTSNKPAHPPITEMAREWGLDLHSHRTTAAEDFLPQPGDYLLAMEVRHLRRIAAQPRLADLPRGLLGTYAERPVPHLHDPYRLSDAYTRVCLARIERSVAGLCRAFSSARHS